MDTYITIARILTIIGSIGFLIFYADESYAIKTLFGLMIFGALLQLVADLQVRNWIIGQLQKITRRL